MSKSDYEIIEASAFEWGLVYKGLGIVTWWKSEFNGKPDLSHPLIQKHIKIHKEDTSNEVKR